MIVKKTRPKGSSTSSQVFWFWLKAGNHKIDKEHHYNMLMGIGCKDRTLKRFINANYCFDEKSVVEAIIDSQKQKKSILDKDFLVQHLTKHYAYGVDVQNEIAKIKGIKWMIEKGFILEECFIRSYLKNANQALLKSLIPYVQYLANAEKDVFECGYAPLVIQYLKVVRPVKESNVCRLLSFNDASVYNALFDHHSHKVTNKLIAEILTNKSDDIVYELVKFVRLNAEQEILLIKRNNFFLLKTQLDNFGNVMCKESIDYLSKNASNQMFKDFASCDKIEVFNGNYPDSFYERLFKLNDKKLLKSFISSSYLPTIFEEELLKLNDKELIKEYFGDEKQVYSNKSAIHILRDGTKDKIDDLLESDYSIGFYGEAWLFKSGLNDYISRYLKNRVPTGFGEACLIKFADKKIVIKWLSDEVILRDLSFIAAMERKDDDIIKRIMELMPGFYEEEQNLEALMLHGSCDVISHFFENLEESEYLNTSFEVSEDVARQIFSTRDKEVQELFVNWFDIDDSNELCNALVKFAHKDIVIKKLNDNEFSFDVESLFKRSDLDRDIIATYLKHNELSDGYEEFALLLTLDEDMVLKYQEEVGFDCIDDDILDEG
ncbi:MAG: hypothetical protein IKW39_03890 [Alphaproteobacteria bacterium]|nr:hypothetical protein [Alphaproteobacteria bacterium]